MSDGKSIHVTRFQQGPISKPIINNNPVREILINQKKSRGKKYITCEKKTNICKE